MARRRDCRKLPQRAAGAGALALLAALGGLTACARPVGDFGRAEPSYLHDSILPALGDRIADRVRKEPVSGFDYTMDEVELRNRAWAFVRAPHVRDWWLGTLVEAERSRILPMLEGDGEMPAELAVRFPKFMLPALAPNYDPTRYYAFLHSDGFRAAETRWTRVIDDITADRLLLPPFCEVAARVRSADIERLGALDRQGELDTAFRANAEARIGENETTISWVWRALGYRAASYRFAIDRLEVETPGGALFEANRGYQALALSRCEGAAPLKSAQGRRPERHSRLMDGPDPFDAPVLQK